MTKGDNKMRLLFIVATIGVILYLLNTGRVSLPNDGTLGGALIPSAVSSGGNNLPGYVDVQKMGELDGAAVSSGMNSQQSRIMDGLNTGECYPRPQLSAEELLPKDSVTEWGASNPNGVGSLCDKNFLDAGALIGISSVGQTLRKNPNLQLRSEPIIEQRIISPFLQSTIPADLVRRPLEIGSVPLSCSTVEWA